LFAKREAKMETAELTMIENLHKNSGKTIDEWIKIVNAEKFEKHGQIVSFLKEKHGFTHGYANLVAHKSKSSDAGSVDNKDELIEKQYKGKEHFKPLYNSLMASILKFGNDIEIAPKNAYISLRRKKQFAILQPATKTRFEIGINLKGHPAEGVLEAINTPNAMCSHKINLTGETDLTPEVFGWLKKAYENS
jgi:predicted transport protein